MRNCHTCTNLYHYKPISLIFLSHFQCTLLSDKVEPRHNLPTLWEFGLEVPQVPTHAIEIFIRYEPKFLLCERRIRSEIRYITESKPSALSFYPKSMYALQKKDGTPT